MSGRKHGLLSRRASQKDEIVNRVLNVGETYRGVELCAVSPADLEQKRREVDREFARRLFDAPDAEARALILKELHPPTKPRPERRRVAESSEGDAA